MSEECNNERKESTTGRGGEGGGEARRRRERERTMAGEKLRRRFIESSCSAV